jgi:prophage maintenance system killer protein
MIVGELITVERIIALHGAICGHVEASPRPGCLETAIGPAVLNASYASENGEPDLLVAACYLARGLSHGQCFLDGNKRVTLAAFLEVLEVHGSLTLGVDDQAEAASYVEALSERRISVGAFAEWAAVHLVALRQGVTVRAGPAILPEDIPALSALVEQRRRQTETE